MGQGDRGQALESAVAGTPLPKIIKPFCTGQQARRFSDASQPGEGTPTDGGSCPPLDVGRLLGPPERPFRMGQCLSAHQPGSTPERFKVRASCACLRRPPLSPTAQGAPRDPLDGPQGRWTQQGGLGDGLAAFDTQYGGLGAEPAKPAYTTTVRAGCTTADFPGETAPLSCATTPKHSAATQQTHRRVHQTCRRMWASRRGMTASSLPSLTTNRRRCS